MGWSIDTARADLDKIFRQEDRLYHITHAQSAHQGVVIEHLGDEDLPVRVKKAVANMFPDFVYIDFILVQASQVVGKQMEWDNAEQEGS